MLDLFLAKVTLVSDSFMLSAQFPLIDKKNARNDKFSSLNARWNSRLFCASHSYNKRYKTCWPSRKQQLKEAKFWLYSKRNSEHNIKLNASYYSGRRHRVKKCRWFVFCRRRRRWPTFEIAQYGPHTSLICTGKMADACLVCLYKQETSSRGITFICVPFFC